MSYGMGSDEDTVPLTHHGRRGGGKGHGTRSGSNRSKRGNSSKASRFAKELYGDTYSTSSSSSSSSFRTKAQRRDTERRHANFLAQEMKKQDQLIKEQDSSLEMLSSNLTRLGDISHVVSRELDQQADMLDDLDKEVNKAEEGLERVNALAKDLIKNSGGPGWFCLILVLVAIILFLFFLLMYT